MEEFEIEYPPHAESKLYKKAVLVAPSIFRRLRSQCRISEKKFLHWMSNFTTPSGAGAGRSGAYFFYGKDQMLILKSMTKTEMDVLKMLLADYYRHIAT